MMNGYYPGQAVRSSLSCTAGGVLTNPPLPTVTVSFPDGSSATPLVTIDGQGQMHADFLIPQTMKDGIAVIIWESFGSAILQNATQVDRIRVLAIPSVA